MKEIKEMSWVLIYPDKDRMPLSFALDGHFTPYILKINENLLADELVAKIDDEISGYENDKILNVNDKYEILYEDIRKPFEFSCAVKFTTYKTGKDTVFPGRFIEIENIEIHAYWNNRDLPVKWCEELLKAILETQIHIPLK